MTDVVATVSRLKPANRLEQAVAEFEAILSPDQKASLKKSIVDLKNQPPEACDVKQLTAEIDRCVGRETRRCFGPRFMNVLEAVQRYAALGDIIMGGSQNLVACGVWASVRLTLMMLSQGVSCLEKMSLVFMNVGRNAPRYQDMVLLYPRSRRLQNALCEYFIVVVNLCQHATIFSQSSAIFQISTSVFDPGLSRFQKDIDVFSKSIIEEVTLLNSQRVEEEAKENSRFRNMMTKFSDDSQHQRRVVAKLNLLDACSRFDYQTIWKQARKRGTTTWFTTTVEYQNWIQQTSSGSIVCSGKLGSGKTTLMANMVADLGLFDPKATIAYFFCRYDIAESLTARIIFGCLARQLLEQRIDIKKIDDVLGLQSHCRDCEEILECMRILLPHNPKYYVLLDGVDECERQERQILMELLRTLQTEFTVLIGISLRTGAQSQANTLATALTRKSTLHIPDDNPDIAAFIKLELQDRLQFGRLSIGDHKIRLAIHDALVNGSQGMFLWAALQLDCICAEQTDNGILHALKNIPKDLSETFRRVLDKSTADSSHYRRRIVELVLAARRPLKTAELREALSVNPGDTSWDQGNLINNIHSTLTCCGSLIVVDEEELTVRFAHHSIQRFFIDHGCTHLETPIKLDEASQAMGRIILTYLNYDVFDRQVCRTVVPKVPATFMASKIVNDAFQEVAGGKKFAQALLKPKKKVPYDMSQMLLDTAMVSQGQLVETFHFINYAKQHYSYHIGKLWQESGRMHILWNQLLDNNNHLDIKITSWVEYTLETSTVDGLFGPFIPHDILDRLCTYPIIRRVVQESGVAEGHVLEITNQIYPLKKTCFAILVAKKLTPFISNFATIAINDEDLPVTQAQLRAFKSILVFDLELFYIGQAPFVASMIPKSEIQAIPLLHTNKKPFGVLDGTLITARIHPAHNDSSIAQTGLGSFVTVKELPRSHIDDDDFVGIQNKFSPMHIVTIGTSFPRDGKLALIFDLAEGNLNGLWQQCLVSSMDEEQLVWWLLQMINIAKALSSLSDSLEYLFRCHGNIKPENILWFKSNSSSYHRQTTEEVGSLKLDLSTRSFDRYNPYQAPECATSGTHNKGDVWSLGCVYLEFATWIVMGWEGVQGFRRLRGASKPFYKFMEGSKGPILREEIVSWVSSVKSDPRCPRVISHLLQYLLERAVVADPEERAFPLKFESDLAKFVDSPDLRMDSGDFPNPGKHQSEEM